MIIRQGINFVVHLVAGALLGAMVVGYARSCRATTHAEPLEPRYTPPPPASPPSEAETGAVGM